MRMKNTEERPKHHNNVALLRKKFGINQKELAEQIGISRTMVCDWERQYRQPSKKSRMKMAELFSVSPLVVSGELPLPEAAPPDITGDDKELWELREAIRYDPNRKELLKLARYGSKKDIQQVVALVDAMRATNPDFYDGEDPS